MSSTDPPFYWGTPQQDWLLMESNPDVKVQLCQPRSPFSPLSAILLPNPCLDVKLFVEIIAMLDRIWGTASRQLCGCLGEGASGV